jgi:flagellin-specific chaperone FliS
MERVEGLAEELNRRGDLEAVERIRRAAGELARISEKIGWRAVEDVSVVLPAVGRAFEEAVRAVGESRDAARLVEAFKAKAEEAAKQLEQRGARGAADRVRRAAERVAEEVRAGGWGAVERLRPLLSPERGGDVLGRLESLHTFFTNAEALSAYRELRRLQRVEEAVREVRGAASGGEVVRRVKELERALGRAPEDVKAAFGEALKALERGDFEGAAKGLDRVLKIVEEKRARLEPLEWEIGEAKAAAERLGLSNVLKALERPDDKRIAKALGELERELARLYGAL